ncbi:MAG: DMT family transporter [Candidatus Ozemobacteraceae bacterium]
MNKLSDRFKELSEGENFALGMLIAIQLINGGTYLMVKVALRTFDPFSLGCLRLALAGSVVAGVMWARGRLHSPRKGDRLKFLLLATLAVPLNQGLFLYGMKFCPAAHGALLYAMTPTLVLLLSTLSGLESPNRYKIGGIFLSFTGVATVLFERGLAFSSEMLWGDGFLFAAVCTWALYTMISKRMVARYSPFYLTGITLSIGALLYLPIGLPFLARLNWSALDRSSFVSLFYLAFLTSVVTYFVFTWALSKLDASRVSIVANLQPIVAALLGWFFLGERVTLHFWFGAALVAGGVLLAQRRS